MRQFPLSVFESFSDEFKRRHFIVDPVIYDTPAFLVFSEKHDDNPLRIRVFLYKTEDGLGAGVIVGIAKQVAGEFCLSDNVITLMMQKYRELYNETDEQRFSKDEKGFIYITAPVNAKAFCDINDICNVITRMYFLAVDL